MKRIRLLVVEDSLTIRKRLLEVLETSSEIEVVGEAEDGEQAIELCLKLKPDVITLDMMMPVMNGLAATEFIMARCPTPIVIVSASTNRGELFRTYDALAAGAVDVVEKPDAEGIDEVWRKKLTSAVRIAARVKAITHLVGRPRAQRSAEETPQQNAPRVSVPAARLVAIGASTGGPGAIVDILRGLTPSFTLPILLVLHIGKGFGAALAEWLDSQSRIRVACAVHGEPIPQCGKARVLMAPPDRHMFVQHGRIQLSDAPERHSCRPSVDVLFESIAAEIGSRSVACLLTGMGRDGAAGLLAIRRAGGTTIAQDESTSIVFGMPREAISLGAAQRVLPLHQVATVLDTLAYDTLPEGAA